MSRAAHLELVDGLKTLRDWWQVNRHRDPDVLHVSRKQHQALEKLVKNNKPLPVGIVWNGTGFSYQGIRLEVAP